MTNFDFDFDFVRVSTEDFLTGACKGTNWKVYSFRNKHTFEHVSDDEAVFSVIGDSGSEIAEKIEVIANKFAFDSINDLIDAIYCYDPCI